MRKKIVATIISVVILLPMLTVVSGFAATEEEIEDSIALGLPWLASQQNPDGSWGTVSETARTGLAVLKLIDRARELGYDYWDTEYNYSSHVENGLNYLFNQTIVITISNQTAGNPDTNNNSQGCYYSPEYSSTINYESAIALMGIANTKTPDFVVNVSGSAVDGWTYGQVVQDSLDFFAYSQSEAVPWRGGWGYAINAVGTADNSVSGYVALAIGYAKNHDASIILPQYVLDELEVWIATIQAPAGYSYYRPSGLMTYGDLLLKTGNLLYEMALVGMPVNHPNVTAALTYIENNWALGGSSYQRAYCLMKGLEAYGVEDEISVGGSGDWFNETSTYIVNNQNKTDGYWPNDPHDGDYPYPLTAAWALLTLEKAVAILQISADVDIKPGSWPNPINKDKNGVTSIAICGAEDFDVMTIDPVTVKLHNETSEVGVPSLRWSYEDVATPYPANPDDPEGHDEEGDGYVDLVFKFDTPEFVDALDLCEIDDWEYIKLFLKGNLFEEEGGTPLEGFDWVRIQSSKGKGK